MLKLKLITLAGVLGILACGACFREAYPPSPLPPPPAGVNFAGVHEIAIAVENGSDPPHLDARQVARSLKSSINDRGSFTTIHAHLATESGAQDALLEVEIDTRPPVPEDRVFLGKRVEWVIPIKVTAKLTRRDGTLLWARVDDDYSYRPYTKAQTSEEAWRDRGPGGAEDFIGHALMSQMFYGVKDK